MKNEAITKIENVLELMLVPKLRKKKKIWISLFPHLLIMQSVRETSD